MAGKASQSVDPLDDPVNVQPQVWPECPTCGAAYILRRGLSISRGWLWAWYRDCKHKSPPKVHDAREGFAHEP